ncbi:hypothetical protein [Paludisphaera borealis]|uniref:Uncharacterized protein n=1 Tax=Paludisphaera borealis TaxID=1387353 RepID=A0A1U7CY43_9BACT|nr:hypothetical protein [Paludisphaera borealis]APW63855.1 hypothetical protein BSF38_05435 [Paludisphaera borealis]
MRYLLEARVRPDRRTELLRALEAGTFGEGFPYGDLGEVLSKGLVDDSGTIRGEIVVVPERGTMMGDRSRLHDAGRQIHQPWQVKRWLLCRLEFNGRRRVVVAPDRYTELFFLDEATGLAAGHQPCFECRRKSYNAFVDAWAAGNPNNLGTIRPTAASIDERLHAERVGPGRSKRTFKAKMDDLPDGVFVTLGEVGDRAHLLWERRLLAWPPGMCSLSASAADW